MASATTLYGKAAANYKSAKLLIENANGDEEQLNIAGYHLQQAVEQTIKYLLEQDGVEYPKTHDIEQLARIARESDVNLMLPEYIDDHAEMFSQWEAKARYIIGYAIEKKKLDKALHEVDAYLTKVAESENARIAASDASGQEDEAD